MADVREALPSVARAWMAHTRLPQASARLRTVAPGPVRPLDLDALRAALGQDVTGLDREDVLRAISLAARAHPDPAVRRALESSVDAALDELYP